MLFVEKLLIYMLRLYGVFMIIQLWAHCQAELQEVIMHVFVVIKIFSLEE